MNAAQHSVPSSERQATRQEADLEPTTHAVAVAHLAHLQEAFEPGGWERRGFLGRLTRLSRADVRGR